MAHMVACKLRNAKIVFHTDNYPVMLILNSQTSKSPVIMPLVRQLVLLSLQYNFLISARFVPGITNTVSDTLSRFKESAEFLQNHGLEAMPTAIDIRWHPKNWTQQPGIY